MNEQEARQLIDTAKHAWRVTADLLEQIFAEQAWLPLGYDTAPRMWEAEFGDIPLAVAVGNDLAYRLFAAGATDEEVSGAVPGVGTETAASLRQQQDNGVPAVVASRASRRRNPGVNERRAYDRHIDLVVTEEEFEIVAEVADREGKTVVQWSLEAVRRAVNAANGVELDEAAV
jgi:hypothetical protein